MANEPIVVVGGGGHGLVVAEAAVLAGYTLAGLIDDDRDALLTRLGICGWIGGTADAGSLSGSRILCVGDVRVRAGLLAKLPWGAAVNVVHPHAWIAPSASLGKGIYAGPRCVVHTRARVGDHAILNSSSIIEHECVVGANVHIAPGAVLGGNVSVGPNTLVGLGARVLPGVRIGSGALIGAGAVVVEDVEDDAVVKGVPAR